jgi:hypothetical protein
MNPKVLIAGIAAVLVAAAGGYLAWSSSQKTQQQAALRALLSESTSILRDSLAKGPTPEVAAKLDANLQAIAAPRDRAFADAAEHYVLGAREIVRKRLDADRLIAEAGEARRVLAAHLARPTVPRERWIHAATEMKRRVEMHHGDLGRVLKALDENLESMADAHKRLEPFVAADALIAADAVAAARKRAQAEAAAALADLEKARSLAPR